jgi:hypothetical protein
VFFTEHQARAKQYTVVCRQCGGKVLELPPRRIHAGVFRTDTMRASSSSDSGLETAVETGGGRPALARSLCPGSFLVSVEVL